MSDAPQPPKPFGGMLVWFILAIVVGLVIYGIVSLSNGMFPGTKN